MRIHTQKVMVSVQHELRVKLPDAFPTGEAEIVVRSSTPPVTATQPSFDDWLAQILHLLPSAPAIPLEALRRENLYEDR